MLSQLLCFLFVSNLGNDPVPAHTVKNDGLVCVDS